jgi:hypothetical protein
MLTEPSAPPSHPLDFGPQPWELADALTRSSLSTTTVGFMEDSVTSLAARYPFTPPADLIPGVQSMLRAVNDALGCSQPLSVRARCVRLAGGVVRRGRAARRRHWPSRCLGGMVRRGRAGRR